MTFHYPNPEEATYLLIAAALVTLAAVLSALIQHRRARRTERQLRDLACDVTIADETALLARRAFEEGEDLRGEIAQLEAALRLQQETTRQAKNRIEMEQKTSDLLRGESRYQREWIGQARDRGHRMRNEVESRYLGKNLGNIPQPYLDLIRFLETTPKTAISSGEVLPPPPLRAEDRRRVEQ